jgi:hypothetical protein
MKKSTRKVWVNPVERISPQGRDRQYYVVVDKSGNPTTTMNMKKTREKNTGVIFTFPFNKNNGKLHTGLSKLIVNPYYKMSLKDLMGLLKIHSDYIPQLKDFLDSERVTHQQFLEIKHGMKPGEYNNDTGFTMFNDDVDINKFDQGKGILAKLRLVLYDRPNSFSDDTIESELKIVMIDALKDANRIASSKDKANPVQHQFYVSEDNEEETNHAKKRDIIEAAIFKLVKLKIESPDFKAYQFAVILRTKENQTLVIGESSAEKVKAVLSDYVSDNNSHQIEHISRFTKLWDLSVTPEGADKVMVYYTIQQAINTGVISYRNNEYFWLSKSGTPDMYDLGNSFETISNFYLKEMNTPVPKGNKTNTNYYKELVDEIKAKGIKFE